MTKFVQSAFPFLTSECLQVTKTDISWSVERDDAEELSDELLSLENFFNQNGYKLLIQDDSEYFGAQLSQV
jgi:membrane-bound lytic murein transglycosylase MltF